MAAASLASCASNSDEIVSPHLSQRSFIIEKLDLEGGIHCDWWIRRPLAPPLILPGLLPYHVRDIESPYHETWIIVAYDFADNLKICRMFLTARTSEINASLHLHPQFGIASFT